MALASLGKILWPDPTRYLAYSGISTNANYQINTAGHRIGWVFQVPMAGTITKVGIRIHTCATAQLSRLGLYTVDGSGNPTSTGYGSSAYGTFTPAATTYFEVTLGTPATATVGDLCALVVEFDSTGGDMFVTGANGTWNPCSLGYVDKYTSSWAHGSAGSMLMAHLYYSDSSGQWPDFGCAPFTGVCATGTFNLNTAGADEYALKITPPFKARIAGIWHNYLTAAGADYEAILYEGTTARATQAIDGDYNSISVSVRHCLFATPYTIAAGTTYYAAIRPTTTANVTYRNYTLEAAKSEQGLGIPQNSCLATRVDQGAWDATATTTLPSIGLIIDQLDDGAGGAGGLLTHPGMAGGMRG